MRIQLVADNEIMFVSVIRNKVTVNDALTGNEEIKNEFSSTKEAIAEYQKIIYALVQEWGFRPVVTDAKKAAAALTGHIAGKKPPRDLPPVLRKLR